MALVGMGHVESRRWPVLIAIAVLLSLAGIANASQKTHRQQASTGSNVGLSAVYQDSGVTSAAWYCAGPLPLKSASESSSLVLNNLSSRPVSAEVDLSNTAGAGHVASLVLPANGGRIVSIGHSSSAGFASASILTSSAAVGVVEVVHGPEGVFSAPCVATDTNVDYLAGGSTNGANNMALALFDPGATPAVASVIFTTSSGPQSPPAFQGLPLAAGQLVVLNVGHYLPGQKVISVSATSSGGRIVVGALDTTAVGPVSYGALEPGTPALSSSWYFAPAPAGSATRQHFIVSNPSATALRVHISLGDPSSSVSESITVPPGSSEIAAPLPDSAAGALRWAVLSSRAGQPFSVARQTTVGAATSLGLGRVPASSPSSASQAPGKTTIKKAVVPKPPLSPANSALALEKEVLDPVSISPGNSITSALLGPARGWLLVGQSDGKTGEVVVIANPNQEPANISLEQLGASSTSLARYGLLGVVISGHGTLTLNLGAIYKHAGVVSIALNADLPVVAGPVIYARGSSGSVGFSAPAAIPVD